MSTSQGESRQVVSGQHRPGGDDIRLPRLPELLRNVRTAVVPSTDEHGCQGWRLRWDAPGITSLFFATGPEKPDHHLVDAALRAVHLLALDHDTYTVIIEVRRVFGQQEPDLDIYIGR